MNNLPQNTNNQRKLLLFKLICYSSFGIFVFFIPITVGDQSTILLDHLVTGIRIFFPKLSALYALVVVIIGGIYPFIRKTWNKSKVSIVFSGFKLIGIVASLMYCLKIGPVWYFADDMGPFLFEKLVIPVGIIVPIGAIFLAFLVDYGLLEFVGILMQPVMKPVWKTSGRSAIDALASFVGSYSIGLLITNRVFKEGKYTIKEAAIIATGFSTVSATFMIIVAKTGGLMHMWIFYFISTMIITFLVTAITVRLYPLAKKKDTYFNKGHKYRNNFYGGRFKQALNDGLNQASEAPGIFRSMYDNLRDGFKMAMGILPSIMSVGFLGLVLVKFTPLFDLTAYIFYPFTWILQIPDTFLAAKAIGVGITEMFLPPLLVTQAALVTRYVISVVCVSSILFFSASIPCILSTEISISVFEIIIIWLERSILSLILAGLTAIVFF